MKLEDVEEADAVVKKMLRIPFDGLTRSSLIKLQVLVLEVLAFRQAVQGTALTTIEEGDVVRQFIVTLLAED